MKREIKFRAWMKPDKVMITHDDIMNIPVTYHDVFEGNSKYPCMQYAGKKDKNGVEIYDYDIVQSTRIDKTNMIPESVTSRVEFHPSCGFQLNKNAKLWSYEWVHEVIGNKFENQDLWERIIK